MGAAYSSDEDEDEEEEEGAYLADRVVPGCTETSAAATVTYLAGRAVPGSTAAAASVAVCKGIDLEHCTGLDDEGDDAEVRGIDLLGDDCLTLVLAQPQCGYSLARAQGVCRAWRRVASQEPLWENAVNTRWRLAVRGRTSSGKTTVDGERSWRELWRVFHRRNRMPRSRGLSFRAVSHAGGFANRVGAWVVVNHQPACRLIPALDGAGAARLSCKLLLQNLRAEVLVIRGGTAGLRLSLHLRDGRMLNVEQVGWSEALPPADVVGGGALVAPPPNLWVLQPLQVMVVEFFVHTPREMQFEPDALEACHLLTVTLPQSAQIRCRFEGEDKLWTHYEMINSTFYAHHDQDLETSK